MPTMLYCSLSSCLDHLMCSSTHAPHRSAVKLSIYERGLSGDLLCALPCLKTVQDETRLLIFANAIIRFVAVLSSRSIVAAPSNDIHQHFALLYRTPIVKFQAIFILVYVHSAAVPLVAASAAAAASSLSISLMAIVNSSSESSGSTAG